MKRPIRVGEVYIDCAYHLVWCTRVIPVPITTFKWLRYLLTRRCELWEVYGVSLHDGSAPRHCEWNSCRCERFEWGEQWLKNRKAFQGKMIDRVGKEFVGGKVSGR